MAERLLHYVIESGASTRCFSEAELPETALDARRAEAMCPPDTAGAGQPGKNREQRRETSERCAAALPARPPSRIFSVKDGDLSALFDFYLSADRLGLAEEAQALIRKTQGEKTLAQVKRLSREALGCRLFYGADDSEVQAEGRA
jgi:hypothetical protein